MEPKKFAFEKQAIENDFPFDEISKVAKSESWRKEVYRPIYYLHKWWAKRLGSVFRAIVIGSCAEVNKNILDLLYQHVTFSNKIIYDPMMGSGVTIGEAKKLGCQVIGRDINPVSYLLVKSFMNDYSVPEVKQTFHSIEKDVSKIIKSYYKTKIEDEENADVLYYFWVKTVACPFCNQEVDLFPSRVFSKHAYPKKTPSAKSLCPNCDRINAVSIFDTHVTCEYCGKTYNPQKGTSLRSKATCVRCNTTFSIIESLTGQENPPKNRMYAKMVLRADGKKEYHPINDFDKKLYDKASSNLKTSNIIFPRDEIKPGYNTNQILKYNYRYWHQLFNDRQLFCLGTLGNRISEINDQKLRELFTCLFSGCLEFNNMFCSFKGEGTGAVRHMFSHHILKPEKIPLEANIWGTPKSSGSFSTLFQNRVMRALKYKEKPFELSINPLTNESSKVYGISQKVNGDVASTFSEFMNKKTDVYLSCGSSDKTDIESGVVDVIVTDPPFFANVHYSELADFFFVWQRQIMTDLEIFRKKTTRSVKEIQQIDSNVFTQNLTSVFSESHRVLKENGLMVFTFHQSQIEGWTSLLNSIKESGFYIVNVYPVKSEMSVAIPKSQAKNPINLDTIIVCRKNTDVSFIEQIPIQLLEQSKKITINTVVQFSKIKQKLSRNDVKGLLLSNLIKNLSLVRNTPTAIDFLKTVEEQIEKLVNEIELLII